MRDYIDVVEGYLAEAKSGVVEVFGHDVRVWKNPTHKEFFRLLELHYGKLRGTIDNSGDLYVWDPAMAIHHSVEEALQIAPHYRVMFETSEVAIEHGVDEDEFRALPCIRRAYGKMDFDIMNDSAYDDEPEELDEKFLFQDEAYSDVDGKLRPLRLYINPSKSETKALLQNSLDPAGLRGFIFKNGDVVIWDSFIADHQGADAALVRQGYRHGGELRFAIGRDGYSKGMIYGYEYDVRGDRDEEEAAAMEVLYKSPNVVRMFGFEPKVNWE